MTRKERFINALRGEQVDKIPIFDFLDSKKLVKHFTKNEPSEYLASDIMAVTKALNLDGAFIPFGGFAGYELKEVGYLNTMLKENQYTDEWGVVYESTGSSWPADAPVFHPIANRDDYNKRFVLPNALTKERLDGILEAIELNKGYDCAIIGGINGPFTIILMLMGLENMSYILEDDPQLLHEMMSKSLDFLIPASDAMINARVDAIFIADDLGYSLGPFFSPKVMQEFYFPYLKKLCDYIISKNSYICFHSCGNITKVFEDIVLAGVHGVNPIQISAGMDINYIKKAYGDKVTLIGNLDSTRILPYGTQEEVRNEVKLLMDKFADGKRYIFASDSDVRDDHPIENIIAMFDEAHKQSKIRI